MINWVDILVAFLFLVSIAFMVWWAYLGTQFAYRKQKKRIFVSEYKKARKRSFLTAYFAALFLVLGGTIISDFDFSNFNDMLTALAFVSICPPIVATFFLLGFLSQFPKREHLDDSEK